jgi:hypothetical protein
MHGWQIKEGRQVNIRTVVTCVTLKQTDVAHHGMILVNQKVLIKHSQITRACFSQLNLKKKN